MPAQKIKLSFVICLILIFSVVKTVYAVGCDVIGVSASVENGTSKDISIGISIVGDEAITSVQLINPDSNLISFNSGSASGFTASLGGGNITFVGGSLAPASTQNFTINVTGLNITTEELQVDGFVSAGGDMTQCYASSGISVVEPTPSDPSATPTTIVVTNTVTTTTTTTTTNTVTKIVKDETPPNIIFLNKFDRVYEEPPVVQVQSSDPSGISRFEYSVDGSLNWFPIDIGDSIGDKTVVAKFVPNAFEDGDYSLVARSTDTAGNKVVTKQVKFTIDRLPPNVGPLLMSVGPIVVGNDQFGVMNLLSGVEYKLVLAAAGGPNKVVASCNETPIDFTKNVDSGFWFAKAKFEAETSCTLKLKAVDGAGNAQDKDIAELKVNKLGKFENGTITVYWFDSFLNKFVVWDGNSYGQENPIKTENKGYGVILPAGGKYYLEARSFGKRTSVSNIITPNEPVYINDDWQLSPIWRFWQVIEQKILTPKPLGFNGWRDVGFELPKVNLNGYSTLEARGKTTVIGLVSSWHPIVNDYLKVADTLSNDKVNFIPILVQEKDSVAKFLGKRGGYGLNIFADGDGEILKDIIVKEIPTTLVVDRFGRVVKEKSGMINEAEILSVLSL